jgi:pimeloyl-ACP methyl ester carboxylesterase
MAVYDARGIHPGPTVVLVHGVASRASQYAPVATALLSWCGRVVIPDLIGHGESELPPDGIRVDTIRASLTTALDDIVPERMVLVGNSMGAMMAGLYVAERAWRVGGLVLSNPGGAPIDEAVFRRVVELLTPATHTEALELARAGSSYQSRLILHLGARNVLRKLGQPHIRDFLLKASPKESLTPDQVRRFEMPVLLLTGRDDGVIPDETLDWYRRHLPPHAVVKEIDLYGHAPMAERPAVFTGELRLFLARLKAAANPADGTRPGW